MKFKIPYIIGLLLSIIIVIGGLFVGIPLLLSIAPNLAWGYLMVVFIIPLFPAVSAILQGEYQMSFKTLIFLYFIEGLSLFMQLFVLLLYFPLIILGLLIIFLGMFLFIDIVGLIVWVLRYIAGFNIAPGIGRGDLTFYAIGFPVLVIGLILTIFLRPQLERFLDWITDMIIDKVDDLTKYLAQSL